VFRLTLASPDSHVLFEGLLPDTQHQVVIASDVPMSTSVSATIEFKTLAITCPTNLRLQKALNSSSDVFATLLWQPVMGTSAENVNSTFGVVGYAIYIDGQMVHQILDPNGKFASDRHRILACLYGFSSLANMFNLNWKMLPKGASHLTVRTVSGDGNLESADSDKVSLAQYQEETPDQNKFKV
jgi:hypothetical protein